MQIHPLALVHPSAKLGHDVVIGPFCVIEKDVQIDAGCVLESHVVIKAGTRMGPRNHIADGAVIGGMPQHLRMPLDVGDTIIGADNKIREMCTIHRALEAGHATVIGNNNLLMVASHVAHDCHIGNNTVIANSALLAGHVFVDDRAYISGAVAVHQFCRIGSLAMVGGHARVTKDVPPYVTIDGHTGLVVGLNSVGLRRAGYSATDRFQLKHAYRVIYRSNLTWDEIQEQLATLFTTGPAAIFREFFAATTRGVLQERRLPPGATLRLRTSEAAAETDDVSVHAKAG